jgi:hypothetical protein
LIKKSIQRVAVELVTENHSILRVFSSSLLIVPKVVVCHGILDSVRKFHLSPDANKLICRVWISRSVTSISSSTFSGCKPLKEIAFESNSSLRKLSKFSFSSSSLRHIFLPDSVEIIGKSCFRECLSLFNVCFSSGSQLIRIEQFAFAFSSLNHFAIPPLIDFIDGSAFVETQFTAISISSFSNRFDISKCFLEDHFFNRLVRCFDRSDVLCIPASIEIIGRSCFRFCQSLGEIRISSASQLKRLDKFAFAFSDLRRLTIPSSVSEIGNSCFAFCKSLEEISFEINSQLKRIGKSAFNSSALKTMNVPRSVELICESAFNSCPRLEDITFENDSGLKRIEKSVFAGSALRRIVIPNSVSFIAGSAFVDTRVYCISIDGDGFHAVSGSFLYDRVSKKIVRYFGSEKAVIIPSFIEIIGSSCFEMIDSLEKVTFGENSQLRRIGKKAFAYSSLRKLMIPKSVEFIHGLAFLRTRLSSILLEPGCDRFSIHDGFAEDLLTGSLAFYFGNARKIVVSKSILEIANFCFAMCKTIEEVTFEAGSSLTRIGNSAFAESSIRSILIPKSVEFIGAFCFHRCRSLRTIEVERPSSLIQIEDSAFVDTQIAHIEIERLSESPLIFTRPGCLIRCTLARC